MSHRINKKEDDDFSIQDCNQLIYLLQTNRTVILAAEGGQYRSSRIPQVLLKSGIFNNKTICVTEPKRVAAIQLAHSLATDLNYRLGTVIGYSVKFKDATQAGDTMVKFTTHDVLARELISDPLLLKYSVIVVDEIQDDNLYKDILLGLLKCILAIRNDLKILLCSADANVSKIFKFFTINAREPAVLLLETKMYPVRIYYSEETFPNYLTATIDTVINLHENIRLESGKILTFLSGQEDVEFVCDKLKQYAESTSSRIDLRKLIILPMYASLTHEEFNKVFDDNDAMNKYSRVCIVSTNLASEISMVIDNVAFVVDCGFTKVKLYDNKTGIDSLVVVPESQSLAQQRARLAGRSRDGTVYRLYPRSEYESLELNSLPEIQRSSLVEPLMLMMSLGIENPLSFPAITRMPKKNLIASFEELYALKVIDSQGLITESGHFIAQFDLDPKLSRCLQVAINSKTHNCTLDLIKIIAMLQVKDIYVKPHHLSLWSNRSLISMCAIEGDLISYSNILNCFITNDKSSKWAQRRNLNYKSLLTACDIAQKLEQQVKRLIVGKRNDFGHSNGRLDPLRKCLAAGLFANAASLHSNGEYKTVRGDRTVYVHPNSVYASDLAIERPKCVTFVEVLQTTKTYMRHIMSVDESWLPEVAPHFYTIASEVGQRRSNQWLE